MHDGAGQKTNDGRGAMPHRKAAFEVVKKKTKFEAVFILRSVSGISKIVSENVPK